MARAYPDRELHLVMDNSAAHKRVEIRDWLAATRGCRCTSPTSASWINLVEVWFGIIERQAIHRGSFAASPTSPAHPHLHRRLERPLHPFVWTKTAEQILAKADRKKTSDATH